MNFMNNKGKAVSQSKQFSPNYREYKYSIILHQVINRIIQLNLNNGHIVIHFIYQRLIIWKQYQNYFQIMSSILQIIYYIQQIIEFIILQFGQQAMLIEANTQNGLIYLYESLSWKEKINFINNLILKIKKWDLPYGQKSIESSWTVFLKEKNLNILLKIIECLQLYLQGHDIKNLRIKREIIESLFSLAKMNRSQIDNYIVSIIGKLAQKEKEQYKRSSKENSMIEEDDLFNSMNHPTFLTGDFYQTQTNCQMDTQAMQEDQNKIQSFVIKAVIEITQRCQKHQFKMGLQIGMNMISKNILNRQEITWMYTTFKILREIISARKQTKQQSVVDPQISTNYEQFTQAVFASIQ